MYKKMMKMPAKRHLRFVLILASIAALATSVALAEIAEGPLSVIESDYRDGLISLDQKSSMHVHTLLANTGYLDKYELPLAVESQGIDKCGTWAVLDILANWGNLSPETQLKAGQMFLRPGGELDFVSVSGYFRLHYDTSGTNSVPMDDLDSSGIPDFVEKCAAYCDTTMQYHLDEGYLLPPSDGVIGGDSLYDIYFLEMGAYGYAIQEGPGDSSWNDAYSYVVLNNDFLGFPVNTDPEGNQYGAAKVTCAHEFHHAVQFAYRSNDETWFMEQDATAMEDFCFDQSNDNLNYLGQFMGYPDLSLMTNSNHMYASFIWTLYLAQQFDTSLMVSLWEGARTSTAFQSLADTLLGKYGWSIDSTFSEFTTWNFCTGPRDDGLHHEEAWSYPDVRIDAVHSIYPVALQNGPVNPQGYGAAYINFFSGSSEGYLTLTVNGSDEAEWAAYVIKSLSNNLHEFEKINLTPGSWAGEIVIPDFQDYYRVTLVVSNLTEYQGTALYTYSATMEQIYGIEVAILTTDTLIYTGSTREFDFEVTNNSNGSDVIDVIVWDDSGWFDPDTIAWAFEAGGGQVFGMSVTAPQGIAIGDSTGLTFKAHSRGDTTVWQESTSFVKAILQRGDVDYSGSIDIADLTALVEFLFGGGETPQPVLEAADFTCDGNVDVADLTAIVDYLFGPGGPPPCNPY